MNENAWKIKHNILFPPEYRYRLLLFSCWVVSNTLQPHGQQHTRVPCPSLFLGACSNSCPLSQRCHPTILSSFVPFPTCLPSFPALGSFSMSHFFHIRWPKYWSFSFIISSSKEKSTPSGLISFRIDWLISLWYKGLTTIFSRTTVQKHQFFSTQPYLWFNCHTGTWLPGKP